MKVAIIPARGDSTRIPHKNRRLFHGKPIISYSLNVAKELKASGRLDKIVVSTDDDEIRDIAWAHGAQYLEREPEYARNEVGTKAVMGREVERLGLAGNDEVCCIYPTAPMLSASDVGFACGMLWMKPAYFVVSVGTRPLADAGQFYWSLADHWKSIYLSIYGIRTAYFPIESNRVCDINTESDWARAEQMYAALQQRDEALNVGGHL